MRPTLQYIIEKFDYYNKLCFSGQLQRPPIRLNTRYSTMGITKGKQRIDSNGLPYWSDLSIEISVRRDLPEYEYIDTLVHEMIHYYIFSNNLVDDSPHGTLFRRKMDEITQKYGKKYYIQKKMPAACQFWAAIPPKNTSPASKTPNLPFLGENLTKFDNILGVDFSHIGVIIRVSLGDTGRIKKGGLDHENQQVQRHQEGYRAP